MEAHTSPCATTVSSSWVALDLAQHLDHALAFRHRPAVGGDPQHEACRLPLAAFERVFDLVGHGRHDRPCPGQEHRVGAGVGGANSQLAARNVHGAGRRTCATSEAASAKAARMATQHAAATVDGGFGSLSRPVLGVRIPQSPSVRPSQLGSPWTRAAQLQCGQCGAKAAAALFPRYRRRASCFPGGRVAYGESPGLGNRRAGGPPALQGVEQVIERPVAVGDEGVALRLAAGDQGGKAAGCRAPGRQGNRGRSRCGCPRRRKASRELLLVETRLLGHGRRSPRSRSCRGSRRRRPGLMRPMKGSASRGSRRRAVTTARQAGSVS